MSKRTAKPADRPSVPPEMLARAEAMLKRSNPWVVRGRLQREFGSAVANETLRLVLEKWFDELKVKHGTDDDLTAVRREMARLRRLSRGEQEETSK